MRHKSHTSLLQKGWGLGCFIATILLLFPLIAAYTPADYLITTTNINNPTFQVKVNDVWQPLSIKYGLILEGGTLIYSDQVKNTKFFYSNNLVQSTSITATPTTNIKFNVSTIIPDNAIGFFYEFQAGTTKPLYYPSKNTIVYPDKWHIYYKDLIRNYRAENIVVENNRILIYNVQGGKLLNFDPEGGGDGVPTDCVISLYDYYNVTSVQIFNDFNMSGMFSYAGICSDFSMTWQDNSSGSWNTIPAFDLDLNCNGATCSQSPASSSVWYSKYPYCEDYGYYYARINLRYKDQDGVSRTTDTSPTLITCRGEQTNQTILYYPINNTEVCTTDTISFYVNVSAPTSPFTTIRNITLWHNISGNYRANNTWYQHFINSSNVLHLLYFNNSNVSENKEYPDLFTNESLNMESGFLGDYGLNFSNKTGRISYDDTKTLNLTYGTICLWFMPYEDYGVESKYLFIDYANTNENIYLAWNGAAIDWNFKKEHLNNNYVLATNMNSKPKKFEWQQICVAWDNSYSGIYLNGSVKASSTGRAAPSQKQGYFQIGGADGVVSFSCSCVIDEFVIFDRRLSDTQIRNLYLQTNQTKNFSYDYSLPVGTYEWNAQSFYYPSNAYNYSPQNFTLRIRNCVLPSVPLFILSDGKVDSNLIPLLFGFFSVVLVWLIILFLLLWYRRRGKLNVI